MLVWNVIFSESRRWVIRKVDYFCHFSLSLTLVQSGNFFTRDTQTSDEHMKMCFTSRVIGEMQIKSTVRHPLHCQLKWLNFFLNPGNNNFIRETGSLLPNNIGAWFWHILIKLNMCIPFHSETLLLGVYPWKVTVQDENSGFIYNHPHWK